MRVNEIKPESYYGIAKLYSEVKHRALSNFNIVDLRIFSYFSRYIDLESGYFLTELIKSIRNGQVFITNHCDFIRDFVSPEDLFDLIRRILRSKPFNGTLDLYSAKPVSKFELLEYFVKNYSLKFTVNPKFRSACPTGVKQFYCSGSREASRLGYRPKFSSLGAVVKESKYLLGRKK
jgi:nucleoside-diphosphate-sugar epimerase